MESLKFVVKINYTGFEFDNAVNAMDFAVNAKVHAGKDCDVRVDIVDTNEEENKED